MVLKNEAELGTVLGIAALLGVARTNLRLLKGHCISWDDFNRARRGASNDLLDMQRQFPEATTLAHWEELRSQLNEAWTPDPSGGYPPAD